MPSWWGKSSKEAKKKPTGESFIDTLHKKFKSPENKSASSSGGSKRRTSDTFYDRGSESRAESRSPSPSEHVARLESLAETPRAQSLPLPSASNATVNHTDSMLNDSRRPKPQRIQKSSMFQPFAQPACMRPRVNLTDLDVELAVTSVSSECSTESDDPGGSRQRSPLANDHDIVNRTATGSPSSNFVDDQSPLAPVVSKKPQVPVNLCSNNNAYSSPPTRWRSNGKVPILQFPHHGAFYSAPDSSMASPSRSPMGSSGPELVSRSAHTTGKPYLDLPFSVPDQCSSSVSGQISEHNLMGVDILGKLFLQPSRGSPEYSPNLSPTLTSPGPSSRIHSGAVTPVHPKAGGSHSESQSNWHDDTKQQSHPLPLPPTTTSSTLFSHPNSAVASPSVPRSPGRADNLLSPGSRWKKGRLLGRGTFGHVYVGFNSETGEMCAMKEVTLFADDLKSKESAKQLGQEIVLLSRLKHPNIVQYYGSETVDDRLYIYLEYVSGGSIHKILQEYGELGESAIRSFTQQILSGLEYLHATSTVHRDIKGANILVDPSGCVKLADFGMAKHIAGQSCPLSFKGSPYWMAPEVIKNSSGCGLAVDIWSLGCTVLEMATSKPPWSQYEGVAAMFKIGNSKELPIIPDHLSDEGKDFVRLCLQRNPLHRPTAAQLLEHSFVKNVASPEKQIPKPSSDHPSGTNNVAARRARCLRHLDTERLAIHSSRASKPNFQSSDIYIPRNISCPVSPVGSPLLHPRSPQHLSGMMSPSPISSPHTMSGASTPLTGGIGSIPFHNQSLLSPEGFISSANLSRGPCANTTNYWDPDILRGVQSRSYGFRELTISCETDDLLGKQLRTVKGELSNAQSVLADRMPQQLTRARGDLPSPINLSPTSPLTCYRMT